jgi:hypothetical protein
VTLYVTADWSRFVPEGDPEACFGVALVDVDRLGLRPALERFTKMTDPPADKMADRPADKAVRKTRTK